MMTHMKITDWKFWAWLIGTVALILIVGFTFSGSADAATPSTTACMGNAGACGVEGAPPPSVDFTDPETRHDWRCPIIAGISGAGFVGATVSTGGTASAAAGGAAWSAATSGTTCYVGSW